MENIYNKRRKYYNWANYKKQNNFCVNLLRQIRKDYFQSLSGNIKFWKTIKPIFTSKGLNSNKILLKENRNLV